MSLLTRESFLANLRPMPGGPEYGALADHDEAMRWMLRESARLLLEHTQAGHCDECGIQSGHVPWVRHCCAVVQNQIRHRGGDGEQVKIRDGELVLSFDELWDGMNEEQRRTLAQTGVFRDALLNGVIDAVVRGHMFEDDWWWGGDTFQNLRDKLIPLMPDVAKEAVIELKDERDKARKGEEHYRSALWKLERAWHDAKIPDERRDYSDRPRRLTKEEAAEFIRQTEKASP